jgi:hypothetical protein
MDLDEIRRTFESDVNLQEIIYKIFSLLHTDGLAEALSAEIISEVAAMVAIKHGMDRKEILVMVGRCYDVMITKLRRQILNSVLKEKEKNKRDRHNEK